MPAERQQLHGYHSAVLSWVLAALCVWMKLAALGAVLAVFGVLVVRMLGRRRRMMALGAPLARARQALDSGDSEQCEALLDQLQTGRPPFEVRQWVGILRAHIAFGRSDPAAAVGALDQALGGTIWAPRGNDDVVPIVLSLRALARSLLGQCERARQDLAAHDEHPERTADTMAPARLAEACLLDRAGDGQALTKLFAPHATALLNRIGPAQRPLVRTLATSLHRRDTCRTAPNPDASPRHAHHANAPVRVTMRKHPLVHRHARLKGTLTVAALLGLIVGAFWAPRVLAWQGMGIAVLAVGAFAVYGVLIRRGHRRSVQELREARIELIWGDHRRGQQQLLALANGRVPEVSVDACVHLAIDAEERADWAAALDACDAGLARVESEGARLGAQQWSAPKLAELQAYVWAAQGDLTRSRRELEALRTDYPDYPFLVAAVHRVLLMQAAHARTWQQLADLDARRAPAMTISARDELLAKVGRLHANGATRADLTQLRAELDAFPSHERWLESLVPEVLHDLVPHAERS